MMGVGFQVIDLHGGEVFHDRWTAYPHELCLPHNEVGPAFGWQLNQACTGSVQLGAEVGVVASTGPTGDVIGINHSILRVSGT